MTGMKMVLFVQKTCHIKLFSLILGLRNKNIYKAITRGKYVSKLRLSEILMNMHIAFNVFMMPSMDNNSP